MSLRMMLSAVACAAFFLNTPAGAEGLKLVPDDSKISFVGTKPDGKHDGGFKKFTADATLNPENPLDASLKVVIQTASLWSDNPKLTNHLKNPDFFDVRKYPEIRFESDKMVAGDEPRTGKMVGKLTMLGKTETVEVPVVCMAKSDGATLTADFKIDRTKWGMTYGQGKIDNDVAIKATLKFVP
ncbi:YceI family protein [Crateriforma spongiae]|uniref:YceI family protein n=1 Tax=Crateriforma spongiae TaxID=2724528 RepID=UPI001444A6D4|nr:YceI family protein [Crateriforma spongiae]